MLIKLVYIIFTYSSYIQRYETIDSAKEYRVTAVFLTLAQQNR